MKKFKQIFYPIYLIAASVFGYIALSGVGDPSKKAEWFAANIAPARQAGWILLVLFILTMLMLIEIVIENIQLRRLKHQVSDQEAEILRLKAKLYDKGKSPTTDEYDE